MAIWKGQRILIVLLVYLEQFVCAGIEYREIVVCVHTID